MTSIKPEPVSTLGMDPQNAAIVGPVLRPIVSFMQQTAVAVNGNLRLEENIKGVIRELTFTTASSLANTFPLFLSPNLGTPPKACMVVYVSNLTNPLTYPSNGVTVIWEPVVKNTTPGVIDNQVKINYITSLATSTRYKVRFLIFP